MMHDGVLIRGGTSKGIFFEEDKFPYPRLSQERDLFIQKAFGVPDETGMQMNGVGGGISSSSKVVFVGKSDRKGFDLTYDFGQVDIKSGKIDWSGNCGNLASGVLLFAKLNSLVSKDCNQVSIWQVNVQEAMKISERNYQIEIGGVPGSGTAIEVEFLGDSKKNVLPTNNPIDIVNEIPCTLILGSNPTIFVPIEFQPSEKLYHSWMEKLKLDCAKRMGIQVTDALRVSFIRSPITYTDSSNKQILEKDHDMFGMITTPGRFYHHAFTGTGSANVAIASKIPGTVVQKCCFMKNENLIQLGHPGGVMQLNANVEFQKQLGWKVNSISLIRTARLIMKGRIFV